MLPTIFTEESRSSKTRLLHSTETTRIREGIQGQQVVLIGGALSAEDMALQCLKWGAAHVHVVARDSMVEISWTSKWPGDRVTVHLNRGIHSVDDEGRTIHLEQLEHVWPHSYKPVLAGGALATTLRNIHTVVFCTGYRVNLSMLEPALQPALKSVPQFHGTLHPSMLIHSDLDFQWHEWKMSENHVAHNYTGRVPAAQGRIVRANYNHPDMHRGILFRNPNMMFITEHGSDTPLLSLDIHAWLLCSFVTDRVPIPSVDQLREANRQQVKDQMNLSLVRGMMDEVYANILASASHLSEHDSFWPVSPDAETCGNYNASIEFTEYRLRLAARVMEEGRYPGKSLGNYKELNENGKSFVEFGERAYSTRDELSKHYAADDSKEWRTFRDDVVEPGHVYSIYTGTKARPLKKRWMDAVGPTYTVKNDI